MKTLFIGCHCDDIELGCGGTIHKRRDEWDITCVVLSSPGVLKQYSTKSLKYLGAHNIIFYDFVVNDFWTERQQIWETLHELELNINPELVFTQNADSHQDHVTLHQETIRNFKKSSIVSYESSIRNSLNHHWNYFEVLKPKNVEAKLKALENFPCYKDKIYFNPKNIEAQLRISAIHVDSEFAESFKIIKKIDF